jgi:hypothetical protein
MIVLAFLFVLMWLKPDVGPTTETTKFDTLQQCLDAWQAASTAKRERMIHGECKEQ